MIKKYDDSREKVDRIYDVVVVGAGASGIIAAGRAAHMGAKVLLIEKMKQAGRKLSITGKGRCNITNNSPKSIHYKNIFPGGRYLKHAFHNFFVDDILNILHSHGIETVTERGNRVFPVSNKATDVLHALMKWMGNKNIDILYQSRVNRLLISEGSVTGISVLTGKGELHVNARSVIICTGGKSYPATGSTGDGYELAKQAGHSISEVRPALAPLVTKGDIAGKLLNLSLKNVKAVVWVNDKKRAEEFGELSFTRYGLTGPIILTLSRIVLEELYRGSNVEIGIDLKPALDENKLDARLLRDLDANGKKRIESVFRLWLPGDIIPLFTELTGIDNNKLCHQLNSKERRKIRLLMKDLRFTVTGHPGFKEAIITAGGVPAGEIDSRTMESRITGNLFFAGEVIDTDANTGGFNLQIAFSTGWLAAQECVKKITNQESC